MGGAKDFVDGLINNRKVVVFSKSQCSYCHKAKAVLEGQQIKPGAMEWVDIDGRPDCSEIQDYMKVLTGARSVPRVFINGKFFGGGDDTVAASKNGKLAQLLKEAQAV
uniref:Glutaredoxin domain-containing protein n=1 Tax=Angiostrongylus cantonensis TaxID=6313 RepID=A0A0K0CYJ4_ANGCA